MIPNDFNPNSTDATFSRILSRMDYQDRLLLEIREQTTKTNGRVTALERDRWYQRGIIAGISIVISAAWAWITNHK